MAEKVLQNIPQEERFDKDKFTGEDVKQETYDRLAVNDFGMKCLQAMGWNEQRGIGKKQHVQKLVEAKPRHHRQGLGADPNPILDKKADAKARKEAIRDITGQNIKREVNKFGLYKDTEVIIVIGSKKGMKGIILQMDEAKEECQIELKNGTKIKQSVYDVETVEEYEKQKERRRKEKEDDQLIKKPKKSKKKKSRSRSRSRSYSSSSNSRSESVDSEKSSKKKSKKSKKKKDKKKKDKKEKKQKKLKWVLPGIKIKVVSEKMEEFYNMKMVVQDTLDKYSFTCITDKQQYIETLTEKDIQTVMPSLEGMVLILKGEHKGKKAILKARDKKKNQVVVHLQDGDMGFFQCTQDDVSEYVQVM